jgi:hypothetical protein
MSTASNDERAKRDLRLRIARGRRRINGRVRALQRGGRRLISWQTYADWVWRELKDIWAESAPEEQPAGAEGGDDDGT